MPPGRRPKPTFLHVVEGTFRKHRHAKRRDREPQPAGTLGEPPGWFTEAQRQVWAYTLQSAPVGLLRPIDGGTVAAFCVAVDIHRQAVEMLNALGPDALAGPDGQEARVLIQILNGQAGIMHKLSAEMGFSPSSRARVTVDPRVETNPFDEFA